MMSEPTPVSPPAPVIGPARRSAPPAWRVVPTYDPLSPRSTRPVTVPGFDWFATSRPSSAPTYQLPEALFRKTSSATVTPALMRRTALVSALTVVLPPALRRAVSEAATSVPWLTVMSPAYAAPSETSVEVAVPYLWTGTVGAIGKVKLPV